MPAQSSQTGEQFHIHLYGPVPGPGDATADRHASWETGFEEARLRLENELPAVLLEPDGSLAWASPEHQIVGMIYDARDRIRYVELRGRCGPGQLRRLVETLAGSGQVGHFSVMVLPQRQWKDLQAFENSLPEHPASR